MIRSTVAGDRTAVDAEQPTLLLDEVDALFGHRTKGEHEELRGLLNAGHRKGATEPLDLMLWQRTGEPTHPACGEPWLPLRLSSPKQLYVTAGTA